MPKDDSLNNVRKHSHTSAEEEEAQSLLSGAGAPNEEDEALDPPTGQLPREAPTTPQRPRVSTRPAESQRQSSLSRPPENGTPKTPRTANRVRFIVDNDDDDELGRDGGHDAVNGNVNGRIPLPQGGSGGTGSMAAWIEEEDYLSSQHNAAPAADRRSSTGQRAPLLTDIEAPSVTVATSGGVGEDFNAEELLETARPKSGMRSAFMNMANSIIGAGIIGQPYAFRQAGLTTGIVLLVALTFTVDWTIRLIVVNSKLSGANSFQATVQHCYGKSGLIAISVAQWAL